MNKKRVTLMTMTVVLAMSMFGVIANAATTTTATGVDPVKATTNQAINVQFSEADTIELTLSDSSFNFGDLTGVTTTSTVTDPSQLVATVKSSLPYSIDLTATDDFSNTTVVGASKVPVSKLGVNVDGGATSKFAGINTPKSIIANAADTSALSNVTRTHVIKFDLDEVIGYKAGNYTAPLTVTASQQ